MQTASTTRSLRALLRADTAPMHQRLEARIPLLDPGLDRAGYARILAAMLRVYRPLERRLAAIPVDGLGAGRDRKASWLEADLAALGYPRRSIDAIPDTTVPLPVIASVADALGCRYVLEGATLGGSLVSRHVTDRLGLAGGGAAFFSAYGAATGALWREMVALLDRWGEAHPREHHFAVAAARETFEALERTLQADGVLR